MGLVLDSCVLIAAERRARPVSELLADLERAHGGTKVVLSSITVLELEHGLYSAHTPELKRKRRDYLESVFAAIPAAPFTKDMARLAAKIDAAAKQAGDVISLADLLIGVTALHLGYALVTLNLRHFQKISGLTVVQL